MPSLECCIVDAFTETPFQGNPASVVFGADELTDEARQQIAREFNLSETVFVLQPTAELRRPAVRLRWFTPQCEVSFCGHATLAATHAVVESGRIATGELAVECAAGNLRVTIDAADDRRRRYWLAMPPPDVHPIELSRTQFAEALRLPADSQLQASLHQTRDRDLIAFLPSGDHVRTLVPDFAAVDRLCREHDIRGILTASCDTRDPSVACISRFFAPAAGIPEDPVTGSVHGPLAALLIRDSRVPTVGPNHWSFRCRQVPGNGRTGDVYVRAELRADELAIEIGGACVTVMLGRLSL
jgi:PhzF family phenazine biosynthesis protein